MRIPAHLPTRRTLTFPRKVRFPQGNTPTRLASLDSHALRKPFDSSTLVGALVGAQSKRPSEPTSVAPKAHATPLHELYAALGLEACDPYLWLVSRWWPGRDYTQNGALGKHELHRLSEVTTRDLERNVFLCPNPVAHDLETALEVGRIIDGQRPEVMVFEIDGASVEAQSAAWQALHAAGFPTPQAVVHSGSGKVLRDGTPLKRPLEHREGDVPTPSLHLWYRVAGLESGAQYSRLYRAIVEWAASHGVTLDRALGQTNALVRLPGGSNVWADGQGRRQMLLDATPGRVTVAGLSALVGNAWHDAPPRGVVEAGDLPEKPGPLPWIVLLLERMRILDSGIRNSAYMLLAKQCRNVGADLDEAQEALLRVAERQGSDPHKHAPTIDYHLEGSAPFEGYALDGYRSPQLVRPVLPTPGQPVWSSLGAKYGLWGCLGVQSFALAVRQYGFEELAPAERWDALWRFWAAHQWGLAQAKTNRKVGE